MTTQRKQMLALLLLGCALAVHGDARPEDWDPCTQGLGAVNLYTQYKGCSGPHPHQRVNDLMRSLENNLTVHNLNLVFTNYCSSAFPSLRSCFEGNIGNCSSAQQTSLKSIAQQTGFVCEPNTTRTHPVIDHLLERLSDADLVANSSCQFSLNFTMYQFCHNRSMAAIGLNPDNFIGKLKNLTMEQLAPKIQKMMKVSVECVVSEVKRNLKSCAQWRGRALQSIQMYVLPTFLGNRNNFTNDQIDAMFHWNSESQTQTESRRDFGQLFKFFKRGFK